MGIREITQRELRGFADMLASEERSSHTREKYLRDVRSFALFLGGRELTRERVQSYKRHLLDAGYAVNSVNSMLASLNRLLRFLGREDCLVRSIRSQRPAYCSEAKELTREEYLRLLEAAKQKPRLRLLLETLGGTGIRISELQYFTVEAVRNREVEVCAKAKYRRILLPGKLQKQLLAYAKRQGIRSGVIFRTRSGRPLDRSNVWAEMKALCETARVEPGKVFPHNFRKLFARSFYALDKDIAKLADLLGHSSINTTRIYIVSSGAEHRRLLDKMKLVI